MSFCDPIGDMLTRIRNGQAARKQVVLVPPSRLKCEILKVLESEGYIRGYDLQKDSDCLMKGSFKQLEVFLKYYNGCGVIKEIKRVSKPGCRVYSSVDKIPFFRNGLGVMVVSTTLGVMSDKSARSNNVGGEILFKVF